MTPELPRCAVCRVGIVVGQPVIFRRDGRVQHTGCPTVTCLMCNREVLPNEPIRRDDRQLLHAYCWMKRARAQISAT